MSEGSDKGDKGALDEVEIEVEGVSAAFTRAEPPRPPPRPSSSKAAIPDPVATPRRLPHEDLHDADTLQELPVTLDVIYARQNHEIVAIESMATHVKNLDKEWAAKLIELGEERTRLMEIATRLSETAMKMLTARAIMQVVPSASRLVTLLLGATVGAFAGAFTATWMWLSIHPPLIH